METGVEIPLKQICLKRVPKPERASLDLPIKLLFPSVASKVKEKLFLKKVSRNFSLPHAEAETTSFDLPTVLKTLGLKI